MPTLRPVLLKFAAKSLVPILLTAAFPALIAGTARADSLYVSNFGTGVIDQVSTSGVITPYAQIPADASNGSYNYEMVIDHSGNLFVADPLGADGLGDVYKIAPGGVVTTFATGLGGLRGIAMDSSGNLFVSSNNSSNSTGSIIEISPSGSASTYASGLPYGLFGLTFDPSGNLYVAAGNNNEILKVASNGSSTVFATNVGSPLGLASDASGNIYATASGAVDKITPGGVLSTYASGITNPVSLAFDNSGNLYVGQDFGTQTISLIAPNGAVSTFVTATNLNPWGLAYQASAAVPEPASVLLMGSAMLMGLGGACLRRRKAGTSTTA